MASRAISVWRQTLARSVYLAALTIAMAGWVWLLAQAFIWTFGTLRAAG